MKSDNNELEKQLFLYCETSLKDRFLKRNATQFVNIILKAHNGLTYSCVSFAV